MIMTKNVIYFLASSKKTRFFTPVASNESNGIVPPFKIMEREKTDNDAANFSTLIKALRNEGTVYGHFAKEKSESAFTKAWTSALNDANLGHVSFILVFMIFFRSLWTFLRHLRD